MVVTHIEFPNKDPDSLDVAKPKIPQAKVEEALLNPTPIPYGKLKPYGIG